MLLLFNLKTPIVLAIVWALYALAYFGIMRKMGLGGRFALLPFVAEWKMARIYFSSMRSFYQPAFATLLFYATAQYVGEDSLYGSLFLLAGMLVYSIFLIRMYWRIGRSFGKKVLFAILTFIAPFLCLMILGYGKSEFQGGPTFRIDTAPKIVRILRGALVFVISFAEMAVLVAILGFVSIRERPPRILSQYLAAEGIRDASGITEQGGIIKREDVMDPAAMETALAQRSRDYYYPDHSADKSVVVMDYVIGTDLETRGGMASVNLAQIRDATKEGPDMTFVVQFGAAEHAYTGGMADGGYARYTVRDGKIEKVMDLPPDTCMTEGRSLTEFISWAKENYPADRYMLVLWDHGGGLSGGYGYDQLNDRADKGATMPCSDFVEAVRESGMQFDLIGFDTCLMQDIDFAYKLEPYADYYLASEESESGYGWNYTLAFSELAKDPGIATEDFGTYMISSFDPYNTKLKEGNVDTESTLSLVDLTLVKSAHDKLDALHAREKEAILQDTDNYANVSIAANGAYTFMGSTQVDLVDYLERLREVDYEDAIGTEQEKEDVINAVRAAVVCRNANSAKGVNGMAFCFPVKAIDYYQPTHDQLEALGLQTRKSMSDDFFSIMAAQKAKAKTGTLLDALTPDYTTQDWYVKGFEDYDTAEAFVDIPLKDTGAGYQIELPRKAWKSIVDCQTMAYLRTEQGRLYMGSDHIGALDENGNPMVAMDGTWPHIGGNLISYRADMPRETEEGTVFSGTTRALLNGRHEVVIFIECDPVAEESGQPAEGFVTGYELVNNPFAFMAKGMETLEAGDTLEFLFDFYDDEGNLVSTKTYGKKVRVTSDRRIAVKDESLGECDIQFGGLLTDIYQRTFLTEMLEAHAE